jgi:hypothetical protein
MTHDPLHDDALPPELAALSAELDRLAAAEAASAGTTLEDRVLVRTRAAAAHEGMTPEVRRLDTRLAMAAAREVAPAGLEQRVFDATVPTIRGGADEPAAVVGVITRARWSARLALAAGIALAAGAVYLAMLTPGKSGSGSDTVAKGSDRTAPEASKDALALGSELEQILTTTEAEASFAALFAMNVDTLGTEISSASAEADRLGRSFSDEPESTGSGGSSRTTKPTTGG